MRTSQIVLLSPLFDHDARFVARRKPLPIQAVVAELAMKTFDEAILPGMAGRNEAGSDVLVAQPLLECRGRKLAAIIRAQELRLTVVLHGALQQREHVAGANRWYDMNRQTFPRELI